MPSTISSAPAARQAADSVARSIFVPLSQWTCETSTKVAPAAAWASARLRPSSRSTAGSIRSAPRATRMSAAARTDGNSSARWTTRSPGRTGSECAIRFSASVVVPAKPTSSGATLASRPTWARTRPATARQSAAPS